MKHKINLVIFFTLLIVTVILSEENVEENVKDPDKIDQEEVNPNTLQSYLDKLSLLNYFQSPAEKAISPNISESINTTRLLNCESSFGGTEVQILNDTKLIKLLASNPNITSKDAAAPCICVLFFSKHCPFSSLAAPHFNALPRAFPDIKMLAINAMMYHLFNTQNGVVGVPSIILFHNGKFGAKFNESDYTLEHFSRFITKHTGITAAEKSFVTSADFVGPVSSVPSKETDYLLGLSWAFIIICGIYYFTKSKWWGWIIESIQRNWRESEAQAQHEHEE